MADTKTVRRHRGPVTYVLRWFVIIYLFVLVVWPLSEVVRRTFSPANPADAGGLGAFVERLQDPTRRSPTPSG